MTLSIPARAWPLPARPPQAQPEPPQHRAEQLCGAAGQARIALGDQVYTLRITRAGKLILTK